MFQVTSKALYTMMNIGPVVFPNNHRNYYGMQCLPWPRSTSDYRGNVTYYNVCRDKFVVKSHEVMTCL